MPDSPALAERRRKLLYRSLYTGTRETDLLLGRFARARLAGLGPDQLDAYEALLAIEDPRLYTWITGMEVPPASLRHRCAAHDPVLPPCLTAAGFRSITTAPRRHWSGRCRKAGTHAWWRGSPATIPACSTSAATMPVSTASPARSPILPRTSRSCGSRHGTACPTTGRHRTDLSSAQRVDSLARLAAWPAALPLVVLTTANAALQRVPPGSFFAGSSLQVRVGGTCPIEQVQAFLEGNGYQRTGTVREPGEYAIRGGLVDLFPSGSADPLRLDFFGDEIEEIREFDPMSQKSTGTLEELSLSPASELLLTGEGVQRFRTGYRGHFGAQVSDDPLYQAVSEGRRYQGVEHWLPLFHEALETVFDHVGDACVGFDNHAGDVLSTRFEMIAEYYETRRVAHERATGDAAVYRPLPPGLLHVDPAEWKDMVAERKVYRFCGPGELPPVDALEVLHAGARAGVNLVEARVNPDRALQAEAVEAVRAALDAGDRVLLTGHSDGSCARIASLVREAGVTDIEQVRTAAEFESLAPHVVGVAVLPFENGFRAEGTLYITETDVLGERQSRPARRRRRAGEDFLRDAAALSEGDHVVHADYGIARYEGLETLDLGGAAHDCLKLLYADDDRLYVPVENIEILSRYGSSDSLVQLDRLGSAAWQARKSRVMDRLRDMADELIRVAAERQVQSLSRMVPPPGIYDEFCSGFLHDETEDQLRAIKDSLDDLSRGRPMDRLICGDVGFGKTEVALRAAMVAVMDGFQVAVVAPTTLLARQHHALFSQRFAGLPVTVRQLSRLVRPKEAADTRRMIADGTCSVVIGTHAVLAKSVRFDNLGLLVVDEEQRFGVAQKERLKQLRSDVHVLTLTATPIPRTLQLALSGVRDLSIIGTPPVDRLSVRTFVTSWDPVVVREALQRERNRGGQSFCVCPRVRDLPEMYDRLTGLVPDAKIATAHGQMRPAELEEVMTGFLDGESDILLCTNIIESGLDIPNANTIIVHRAENVRAGPALPASRPGRTLQDPGLCLPHHRIAGPQACRHRAPPARGDADPRHPRCRVQSCQPRHGYPRRRQPAGQGAVRPGPRCRNRALPAPVAGSRGGGPPGGQGSKGVRRHSRPGCRRSRSGSRC